MPQITSASAPEEDAPQGLATITTANSPLSPSTSFARLNTTRPISPAPPKEKSTPEMATDNTLLTPFMEALQGASSLEEFLTLLRQGPLDHIHRPNMLQPNATQPAFYLWMYGRSDLAAWKPVLDVLDRYFETFFVETKSLTVNKSMLLVDANQDIICDLLHFTKLLFENSSSINFLPPFLDKLKALLSFVFMECHAVVKVKYWVLSLLSLLVKRIQKVKVRVMDLPLIQLETMAGLRVKDLTEGISSEVALEHACRLLALSLSFDVNHFIGHVISLKSNPTIISDTALLIKRSEDCLYSSSILQEAAMEAIRSSLRFDFRWGEINYALNLGSSHGPLLQILKQIESSIRESNSLDQSNSPFDAHFLITFFNLLLAAGAAFPEALVSADIIEQAILIIGHSIVMDNGTPIMDRQRYKIVDKLLSLLDTLTHRDELALDSFYAVHGMQVIVGQTTRIAEFLISNPGHLATHALATILLSLLKFLQKLLTSTGGAADDRIRLLIDGPLFKTVQRLLSSFVVLEADQSRSQSVLMRRSIMTKCVAVLANYIHTEPTSLTVFQEQGICDSVLEVVSASTFWANQLQPDDLELLKVLPLLFSALCLNQPGLELFQAKDPLSSFLVCVLTDTRFQKTLSQSGVAYALGTAIDELLRHHPSLRTRAMQCLIKEVIRTPAHWTDFSITTPLPRSLESPLSEMISPQLRQFECFCMFLESLLRGTGTHLETFIECQGVEAFLDVVCGCPRLFPFNLPGSSALLAIVAVLRIIGEQAVERIFSRLTQGLADRVNQLTSVLDINGQPLVSDLLLLFVAQCNMQAMLHVILELFFSPSSYGTFITRNPERLLQCFGHEKEDESIDVAVNPCLNSTYLRLTRRYFFLTNCEQQKQDSEQQMTQDPKHVSMQSKEMDFCLAQHIPSQILSLWTHLARNIDHNCLSAKRRIDGTLIPETEIPKRRASGLALMHLIIDEAINNPFNQGSISIPDAYNALLALQAFAFEDSFRQGPRIAYLDLVNVDNLDQGFRFLIDQSTQGAMHSLLESYITLLVRLLNPDLAQGSPSFWVELLASKDEASALTKFYELAAKWTPWLASHLPLPEMSPAMVFALCKLISYLTLTLEGRGADRLESMSPCHALFYYQCDKNHAGHTPNFAQRRALLQPLLFPFAMRLLQITYKLDEDSNTPAAQKAQSELHQWTIQAVTQHVISRCDPNTLLPSLLPEFFDHVREGDYTLLAPLHTRLSILNQLACSTTKKKLFRDLFFIGQCILSNEAPNDFSLIQNYALLLTDLIALQSTPSPIEQGSNTLIDGHGLDPAMDVSNWAINRQFPINDAFKWGLKQLAHEPIQPLLGDALLRLLVACLKADAGLTTDESIISLILKLMTGALADPARCNSSVNLSMTCLRLMVEFHPLSSVTKEEVEHIVSESENIKLLQPCSSLKALMLYELFSKNSCLPESQHQHGIELGTFVLSNKHLVLRDWRVFVDAVKELFVLTPVKEGRTVIEVSPSHALKVALKRADTQTRLSLLPLVMGTGNLNIMNHIIDQWSLALAEMPIDPLQYSALPPPMLFASLQALVELATSYPQCHRALVSSTLVQSKLLPDLVLRGALLAKTEDSEQIKTLTPLTRWMHAMVQVFCLGSVFDRDLDQTLHVITKRRVRPEQADWCRLVVQGSLIPAWQKILSASSISPDKYVVHLAGIAFLTGLFLDLYNPGIGRDTVFPLLPSTSSSNLIKQRQSIMSLLLATQLIEAEMIQRLADGLTILNTLISNMDSSSASLLNTALDPISQSIELLAKVGGRLSKFGGTAVEEVLIKTASRSNSALDLALDDDEDSASNPPEDSFSVSSHDSEEDSGEMDISDDSDSADDSDQDVSFSDDQSMPDADLDEPIDYGYESEIEHSPNEDEDGEEDGISDDTDMGLEIIDDDERHSALSIVDISDEDGEDRMSMDQSHIHSSLHIPPRLLENAVLEVLQRSGIPPDAPLDIIIEQQPIFGSSNRRRSSSATPSFFNRLGSIDEEDFYALGDSHPQRHHPQHHHFDMDDYGYDEEEDELLDDTADTDYEDLEQDINQEEAFDEDDFYETGDEDEDSDEDEDLPRISARATTIRPPLVTESFFQNRQPQTGTVLAPWSDIANSALDQPFNELGGVSGGGPSSSNGSNPTFPQRLMVGRGTQGLFSMTWTSGRGLSRYNYYGAGQAGSMSSRIAPSTLSNLSPHPLQYFTLTPSLAMIIPDPSRAASYTTQRLQQQQQPHYANMPPPRFLVMSFDSLAKSTMITLPKTQAVEVADCLLHYPGPLLGTTKRWFQMAVMLYACTTRPFDPALPVYICENLSLPPVLYPDALCFLAIHYTKLSYGMDQVYQTEEAAISEKKVEPLEVRATTDDEDSKESTSSKDKDSEEVSSEEEDETLETRRRALRSVMQRFFDQEGDTNEQQSSSTVDQQTTTLVFEDEGFDPSFLDAVPFNLVHELIQSHLFERRRRINQYMREHQSAQPPSIHISDDFLTRLNSETRATYQRMSREEDQTARVWSSTGQDMLIDENEDDENDDEGDNEVSDDHMATDQTTDEDSTTRTSAQDNNTTTSATESRPTSVPDGMFLAEPSTLASILAIHYSLKLNRPRSLLRSLLLFCQNEKTRVLLVSLLLHILNRCPEPGDHLQVTLDRFVKKSSSNVTSLPHPTPVATPHKHHKSTLSANPASLTRQAVILQRTLQLLIFLCQRGTLVKKLLSSIENVLSSSQTTPSSVLNHPSFFVNLMSVLESTPFQRIISQAGPAGSMIFEYLLHLLAIVSKQNQISSTGGAPDETPPVIHQLTSLITMLASPTDLTPHARTHAVNVLRALSARDSGTLGTCIIDQLGHIIEELLVLVVPVQTDDSYSSTTPASRLLRILKLTCGTVLENATVKAGEQPTIVKGLSQLSTPAIKEALIRLVQCLNNPPTWTQLQEILSQAFHSATPVTVDDQPLSISSTAHARLLDCATSFLPLLEALFLRWRLLQATSVAISTTSISTTNVLIEFAETHRRVLNALIAFDRTLLTVGSLSALASVPRVLDFDNKRVLFRQQLHRKPSSTDTNNTRRPPAMNISLTIRREQVFEDSFHQLMSRTGEELKWAKLSVTFHGEEAMDVGGVTREWLTVLSRQMFNPDYALFKTSGSDRITYQPNRQSGVNPDHLAYFRFIGRIIGKALFDGRILDAYFTRSLYKHMLGQSPDMRDLEAMDPEYHQSLTWILNTDLSTPEAATLIEGMTFSVEVDDFGQRRIIDLVPGGRDLALNESNKLEYVRAMVEYRTTSAIKPQIEALLQGLREIVPDALLRLFTDAELELLISGLPEIDVDDWRAHTEYHGGYTGSSPSIQWFWRAVRNMDPEDRAKLLQFVTGTSKVPIEGFKSLQGSGGVQKFQIHRTSSAGSGSVIRLPTAHTCFNQLDLPDYGSYEELRDALMKAISECGTGFGFV